MDFDVEKTVSYWVKGAEYDLEVADVLFKGEKYPYSLFMGHLALEKLLKALVAKNIKDHAPITHSLPLLAEKSGIEFPRPVSIKLREFMEFYLEARYPREQLAFYEKCTQSYATEKLQEIKEVFQWLKNKL